MKEDKIAVKVWKILYPFLFYYAVMLVTMTFMQWIFGTDSEHYVICQLVSSLATIPFMVPFYKESRLFYEKEEKKTLPPGKMALHILMAVVIAGLTGTALNNIISMTPLVGMSEGYRMANEHFYGSTLALELVSSAFVTPVLEELVFRGIIFTRLKSMVPKVLAVILSALIFSIMHFNIVQFVYAMLLGIVLALLMECMGHVAAAMAGHMTVNFLAVIRTETGLMENTVKGDLFSWGFSIVLFLTGLLLLVLYILKNIPSKKLYRK